MAEIRNGFVSMGGRPDLEAGVSGGGGGYARGTSVKEPRLGRVAAWGEEEGRQQYFLDSCFLCKRHLGGVGDIFMYRGDMAFCSEECREEEMEIDEMNESSLRKMSMKMKASSRKEQQKAAKSAAHGVTVVAG